MDDSTNQTAQQTSEHAPEQKPFKTEGAFRRTRVIAPFGEVIEAYGDTKAEAKSELKRKLEAYKIPGCDVPGYRGLKYRSKMKVVGYIHSPGYAFIKGEDGKTEYKYLTDRKAQVFGLDKDSK
jgi:hypothetical protein